MNLLLDSPELFWGSYSSLPILQPFIWEGGTPQHSTAMLNCNGLQGDGEEQKDTSWFLQSGFPSGSTLLPVVCSFGCGLSLVSHKSIGWHEFRSGAPFSRATVTYWNQSRERRKRQSCYKGDPRERWKIIQYFLLFVWICLHLGAWRKQCHFWPSPSCTDSPLLSSSSPLSNRGWGQ